MTSIQITDEEMTGVTLSEFSLEILTEQITVRELIRSRVYQQVQDQNLHSKNVFTGLVQPTDTERILNGEKQTETRNWKPFFQRALEAYENNRILIIVGDKQTESLDEKIEIRSDTTVTFMRMVPLVGG